MLRYIALYVGWSGKERWDNGVAMAWPWYGRIAIPHTVKKFRKFFPYSYAFLGFAAAFSLFSSTSLFYFKLHLQRIPSRMSAPKEKVICHFFFTSILSFIFHFLSIFSPVYFFIYLFYMI